MSAPPAATYTAGMPQLAPPYPDWKRWRISRHQTLRRRRPKPRRTISWPRPSTRPLRKIWDPAQNHNEGPGTSESLGPLLQGRISRISELSLRNIFSVSFWTLIQKNKRFGWLSPKTSGKLSALYCHLKFGNQVWQYLAPKNLAPPSACSDHTASETYVWRPSLKCRRLPKAAVS